MNFLAACQRLHLLLRIGEETPGSEPTTVVGQTRTNAEMVAWIAAAHDDICRHRKGWLFMQDDCELALPEAGRIITPSAIDAQVADFNALVPFVDREGAFVLVTPDEETDPADQHIIFVPPEKFFGRLDRAPLSTGQPRYFSLRQDGALVFDTIADRDYTIRTRYRKDIVALAADADEMMVPEENAMAVVEWAIINYYCASRDGVAELYQKHERILRREMTNLYNQQLPDMLAI